MSFDAIVVGLGAVGSATLHQLAKRGVKALGIDRFAPPHPYGSSHGETRITRKAIGEGDAYVPLVLRSHEIWRELEAETRREILTITGGLWISSPARQAESHVPDFFAKTLSAARRFGIAHEILDPPGIRGRFPQFRVADNETGYYEPDAGYVRPEAGVAAQLDLAKRLGAAIVTGERVERIEAARVVTDRSSYSASQVVLAAGARLHRFLPPALAQRFRVTRQVQFWYAPAGPLERYAAPDFPVFIWELQAQRNVLYGFPAIDAAGVKVGTEQYARSVDADDDDWRRVDPPECASMHRELVQPHLPGLRPDCARAVACLYTATRDFGFVIDRHPGLPNVIVASACSGHGFKHSPAIGEHLATWVASGERPAPLACFAWR